MDGQTGPAHIGRADLREFDGHARLSSSLVVGSRTGAVPPRIGDHGDARSQCGPRTGPWAYRRGGGCVAGDRAGRPLRTPHDCHPKFPGGIGRHRQHGRIRPVAGEGSGGVRRPACRGPHSLDPGDPRSTPCRPAESTATAGLPRHGGRKVSRRSSRLNARWIGLMLSVWSAVS